MTLSRDVSRFLNQFKIYLDTWGVFFAGRDKNLQTLLDLDITDQERTNVLRELEIEDYSLGPLTDVSGAYRNKELWIFGKTIKDVEIYNKISLGNLNDKVICISFHIAEHKMKYPLKSK